jgi:hypothetical protein
VTARFRIKHDSSLTQKGMEYVQSRMPKFEEDGGRLLVKKRLALTKVSSQNIRHKESKMSGEYVPPDGEDAVDGMIQRTGCEKQYRALENCIVETDRNFKACQVSFFGDDQFRFP